MNTLLWAESPEMTTAATNLLIVGICAVCALLISRIKRMEPLRKALWIIFFLIMIPTGIYGFFIHALVMEQETKRIAWIFLSFLLGLATTSLSVTLLFEIFGKPHIKAIVVINAAVEIVFAIIVYFLSGTVSHIHLVFVAFTGVIISIIFVFLIIRRTARPHFRWYIIAILTLVIGGLFQLGGGFTVSLIWRFDQNSASHLGIAAALCLFAVGCCREDARLVRTNIQEKN